jgi:hypothetical protein
MVSSGFRFVNSHPFDRQWSRLGLGDNELRALQTRLMFDPEAGDVISGTGGLRKMRWAIRPGQGKSGGARVCYALFRRHGIIYLVLVYAKADHANIAPAKKSVIAQELKQIQWAIERGLL